MLEQFNKGRIYIHTMGLVSVLGEKSACSSLGNQSDGSTSCVVIVG